MIYFLCGHRGCGKNFLAKQIIEYINNIKIIDTGPIVREAYQRFKSNNICFKDWLKENEKKYGENFTNILICKLVNMKKEKNYIVIGYRSMEGIRYFNQYFGIKEYQIFFIDGDYELFRKNYNTREKKDISKEEYGKIIETEKLMGIQGIKNFVLNNQKNGKYYFKTKNDNSIYQDILKIIKEKIVEEER
jgi:adenylate kinase family enzyme